MIIGYSRLSIDDEKTKYVSIENQKRIIAKYAAEHRLVIDKWFEDDGYSGYTMDRPLFSEIKYLVDENLVDLILSNEVFDRILKADEFTKLKLYSREI